MWVAKRCQECRYNNDDEWCDKPPEYKLFCPGCPDKDSCLKFNPRKKSRIENTKYWFGREIAGDKQREIPKDQKRL
jgi:hypothetical protein